MSTFVLLDIVLVANASNEPYFLIREGLPALLEHVGVADMESVVDPVRVDPKHLLSFLRHH